MRHLKREGGGCEDGIIHEYGSRSGWMGMARIRMERDISWVDRALRSTMGYPGAPAGPYLAGQPANIASVPSQIGLQYREDRVQSWTLKEAAKSRFLYQKTKQCNGGWHLGRQSSVVRYPEALLSPYWASSAKIALANNFQSDGDGGGGGGQGEEGSPDIDWPT